MNVGGEMMRPSTGAPFSVKAVLSSVVIVGALLIVGLTADCRAFLTDVSHRLLKGTSSKNTEETRNTDGTISLDYFIAGFAKTGTSTLLRALKNHKETVIPEGETNILTTPGSDEDIYRKLMKELQPLAPTTAHVKRGIKCPQGLGTLRAVQRLERLFPETKLIYGLRHPVFMFQSFYNYRVLNFHRGKSYMRGHTIPSVESLLNETWTSLSADSARYEQRLKYLGKTQTTEGISATPFKVFLYTIEQMQDANDDRKASFRDGLRSFLDLEEPIEMLPRSNHVVADFDETIDICDEKYNYVRNILIENGKETQRWIREELLKSPDVTVANEEHFHELLQTFKSDLCLESQQ